jgi:tRNA(adenine34) deaminase
MRWAIREAGKAFDDGEVPVGAVVVHENRIIGRAYNQTETLQDPTAHAEMIAISAAANTLQSWRLTGCTLYATLEPCAMCAGAAVLARIQNLVFGAWDPKAGACGSLRNLVQDQRLNHRIEVISGVLESEITELMKSFFQNLRENKKRSVDGGRKPGKDPWVPD